MISWEQFFESKEKGDDHKGLEKEEEILHKDLDGDGEKGESAAHKKKVLKKEECKPCKKSKKSKK